MPDEYAEDTDLVTTALEEQLINGVSIRRLDNLLQVALPLTLTDNNATARARRLVQIAAQFEPGALFEGYFSDVYRSTLFRTKRRLLEVDRTLAPYYGVVRPAMADLRNAGLDPAITDMWLDTFLQDDGRYRVQVVAGMCVVGAYNDLGFLVSV